MKLLELKSSANDATIDRISKNLENLGTAQRKVTVAIPDWLGRTIVCLKEEVCAVFDDTISNATRLVTYLTPFNFRPPLIFGRGWPKIKGAELGEGGRKL